MKFNQPNESELEEAQKLKEKVCRKKGHKGAVCKRCGRVRHKVVQVLREVDNLPKDTQNMAMAIDSLNEEMEAVKFYQQRVDICQDEDLKAILAHNRDEEKEHAAMLLEWLRRNDETLAKELKDWLFTDKPLSH